MLTYFDRLSRQCITDIVNVDINEFQWTQATLPIRDCELEIRSVAKLAPSAFLASAIGTLHIQNDILPERLHDVTDSSIHKAISSWKTKSKTDIPRFEIRNKQKEWDNVIKKTINELLEGASGSLDKARLRAVCAPHAGNWLLAPPITAMGLRMSYETIRVATGLRLGTKLCELHDCPCGKTMKCREHMA